MRRFPVPDRSVHLILVAGLAAAAPCLAAQQSSVCPAPEARQFDFWIGEWNVVNLNRRPGGIEFFTTGTATDRVYPVVKGCALVEHWRGEAIGRFIVGFSVRAFDPVDREWDLVLLWPTTGEPSFGILRGSFRHGRGEFSFARTTPEGDTVINRFTFSDIRDDALRWENATSTDGGRSFAPGWIMEFTRRDPLLDGGLLNGLAATSRRCPGEEHRRLDQWLGEWQGNREIAGGETATVRTRLVRILEGCAVMEQSRATDGSWEAFHIRAHEPANSRWTEYAIDTDRPWLIRREEQDPDGLVVMELRDAEAYGGVFHRSTWTASGDGLVITRSTAANPAGPWSTMSVVRLTDRLDDPVRP